MGDILWGPDSAAAQAQQIRVYGALSTSNVAPVIEKLKPVHSPIQ